MPQQIFMIRLSNIVEAYSHFSRPRHDFDFLRDVSNGYSTFASTYVFIVMIFLKNRCIYIPYLNMIYCINTSFEELLPTWTTGAYEERCNNCNLLFQSRTEESLSCRQ